MTPFEDIITDLGNKIGIVLHVDPHQSCRLVFADEIAIQIDLDGAADRLLIGCILGNLTPGPYRANLLKQAMLVNGLTTARHGRLAYSEKNDQLILFDYLPLTITTDDLFEFLQGFVTHAIVWQEAIKRGEIPEMQEEVKPSGMFDLKNG